MALVAAATLTTLGTLTKGPAADAWADGSAGVLPSGWEMCVLAGLSAPVTPANVADLDAWQTAEGGGTVNGEAYNPFNTRRGTDRTEATLPARWSSAGFPGFHSWPDGCAATVATILQPNMVAISSALTSGDVSPPAAFLATVDQTPWCAPSDGVPCYSEQITGAVVLPLFSGPTVAAPPLLSAGTPPTSSSALALYHGSITALADYDHVVAKLGTAQDQLSATQAKLDVADIAARFARYGMERATAALRDFAISEYTSNPSLDKMAAAVQFRPSQSDMLAQYYTSLGSSLEVTRYEAAQTTLGRAQAARATADAAQAQADAAVAAEKTATSSALNRVDITLATLQTAGACADPAPPGPSAAGADPPTVAGLRTCLAALAS